MSVLAKAWAIFIAMFVGGTALNTLFSTYYVGQVLGQTELATLFSVLIGVVVGFTSAQTAMNYYFRNKSNSYYR